MQKIVPFLWFDMNAEEAVNFYVSLFKGSKIVSTTRYNDAGPGPKGHVMAMTFELAGQTFYALNGGPTYQLSPAFSMFVNCETQAEVDELWSKLTANGGEESMCGWLVDRFGLSWQITPTVLMRYIGDKDQARAARVMQAMMQMRKMDIAKLEAAYNAA